MIQVPQKLFNNILARVDTIKSKEDLKVFADKLIYNKNPKLIVAVVCASVGKLIKDFIRARVTERPLEFIKDSLRVYFTEFNKEQGNNKIQKPFRYFEDEYEEIAVKYASVFLQPWIEQTKDKLAECEELYYASKSYEVNSFIREIFKDLKDVRELREVARCGFKAWLISEGVENNTAEQIKGLYDVVKRNNEVVDDIFIKQVPVINDVRVPIRNRLDGARMQDFLLNYCC